MRPSDLSRALDALVQHPEWAGAVAPDRAAVIGHSLGGWTALALVGGHFSASQFTADCERQPPGYASCALRRMLAVQSRPDHARRLDGLRADTRITAAVLLDTGLSRGFTAASLGALKAPVLVIAAGRPDPFQPAALESRAVFEHMPAAQAEYRLLPGATHFSFMGLCRRDGAALLAREPPPEGLLCLDGPGETRGGLHRQTIEALDGFLGRHLPVR